MKQNYKQNFKQDAEWVTSAEGSNPLTLTSSILFINFSYLSITVLFQKKHLWLTMQTVSNTVRLRENPCLKSQCGGGVVKVLD